MFGNVLSRLAANDRNRTVRYRCPSLRTVVAVGRGTHDAQGTAPHSRHSPPAVKHGPTTASHLAVRTTNIVCSSIRPGTAGSHADRRNLTESPICFPS